MLVRILSLYIQSLIGTSIAAFVLGSIWLSWRNFRKKDMNYRERRTSIYEVLLIAVMTVPILAFAVMGLILMIRV